MAKLLFAFRSFAKPLEKWVLSNGDAYLKCVRNVSRATDINPTTRWFPVAFQKKQGNIFGPSLLMNRNVKLAFFSLSLVMLLYLKKNLQWSVSNTNWDNDFFRLSLLRSSFDFSWFRAEFWKKNASSLEQQRDENDWTLSLAKRLEAKIWI